MMTKIPISRKRLRLFAAGAIVAVATGLLITQTVVSASTDRGIAAHEHRVSVAQLDHQLARAEQRERAALGPSSVRVWRPRHLGGAVRTSHLSHDARSQTNSSLGPMNPCTVSQLSTAYWTSLPSLTQVINGFNVTNVGTAACLLPVYPTTISIVTADGAPASEPNLPTPNGTPASAGFVPFLTDQVGVANPSAGYAADPAPLQLDPGGVAVVLLYGSLPPTYGLQGGPSCQTSSTGGGLLVGLTDGMQATVAVPTASQLVTPANPDGSAFVSCSATIYSPFLTWAQASNIVGSPTPSSSTGSLVLSDESIYVNAP